jgi:hypothetical protein
LQADIDGELNKRQLFSFEIPMRDRQLADLPAAQVLVTENGTDWHPVDMARDEPTALVRMPDGEATPVLFVDMRIRALAVVRRELGRMPGPGKEPIDGTGHVPLYSVQFQAGAPTHTGPAADYVAGLISYLTGVEHVATIDRSNTQDLGVPKVSMDLGGSQQ